MAETNLYDLMAQMLTITERRLYEIVARTGLARTNLGSIERALCRLDANFILAHDGRLTMPWVVSSNAPWPMSSSYEMAEMCNVTSALIWALKQALQVFHPDPRLNMHLRLTIGERRARMILARLQAGLTQTRVAVLVGVRKREVQRWEAGDESPNPDNLMKLCEVLEVDLGYLKSTIRVPTPESVHIDHYKALVKAGVIPQLSKCF